MFILAKTITLAGLLLTGNGQQNLFQPSPIKSCQRVQDIIENSPGRTCLMSAVNENDCIPILRNDSSITHETNTELIQAGQACKNEIMQRHTKKLRDHLIKKRKEVDYKRKNLNKDDAYFCKQSKDDIQDLNDILQNR